jgi:hypothetical protein
MRYIRFLNGVHCFYIRTFRERNDKPDAQGQSAGQQPTEQGEQPTAMTTLARRLRTFDYFTLAFGAMVGFAISTLLVPSATPIRAWSCAFLRHAANSNTLHSADGYLPAF